MGAGSQNKGRSWEYLGIPLLILRLIEHDPLAESPYLLCRSSSVSALVKLPVLDTHQITVFGSHHAGPMCS